MIKKVVQFGLSKIGWTLNRIRQPLPCQNHLKIFDLCVKDLITSVPTPFVLQIGANDGIRADHVWPFISKHKWPALLIEPLPSTFQRLQQNYAKFPQVKCKNLAISDTDGPIIMYTPTESLLLENPRLSGLCSLDRKQLSKTLTGEGYEDQLIDEISVPARRVSTLLRDESITKVDILQIDTEGHDWRILSQFDLRLLDVKLINMEFYHLQEHERQECLSTLTRLDYQTAFYLGDLVAYRMQ